MPGIYPELTIRQIFPLIAYTWGKNVNSLGTVHEAIQVVKLVDRFPLVGLEIRYKSNPPSFQSRWTCENDWGFDRRRLTGAEGWRWEGKG
jgi:hypothetical protein